MTALAEDVATSRLAMDVADEARKEAERAWHAAREKYKAAANKYRETVNLFVPADSNMGVK